jgi:hypothetical protein
MTIEIQQPRLEAMIRQRMASGHFLSIEDALLQALESAPLPEMPVRTHRTGADLIAAMQAMPYKDEIEFEHSRPHMPVRDVEF